MRWVVGASLKFRFIVVALTAFLMFFGVQQLGNTAVDVFPEFAPPKVEVHTVAIGLGPTEVEELITTPMEQSFNGIPGVETIRSRSVQQLSQIVLLFEQGTDLLGPASSWPSASRRSPPSCPAGRPRPSCSSRCRPPAGS
jgi:Cu/Ag efflux pump CusA